MPWIYVLSPLKALSTISLIHSHTHKYIHAMFYPWLSTFFNIHTMIDEWQHIGILHMDTLMTNVSTHQPFSC